MTINIMLVDDQTLVREGIKSLLALSGNTRVVAEANDGAQIIALVSNHPSEKPIDVILMDIRMPTMSGDRSGKSMASSPCRYSRDHAHDF